ncbi:MAG: flagellar basal-body MS-ring/collar protein FliF [Betaproteobacteria bacterium]
MFKEFWDGLAPSGRRGLAAGAVVILAVTAALAFWTMRTDYDVLFGNLSARDAASMTEELDRMKLPYRLGADGTSILVDKAAVPSTRLKLMSKDLPLHGAVGFELFNNSDFGMTEFAQKINYQRALQGELTRTILSLQEIESARVHIAFPEDGLFKHDQSKAKASVTLALKPGQTLQSQQVAGIQRLVAASVTGIAAEDVTIVNEHGVALTRASVEGESSSGVALDLKHDIEQALVRKATLMLDKAVGPGRAVVSVDATLDMSQVRVTKEDVTHPETAAGDQPAGVVVRQRETIKDEGASAGAQRDATAGANTQRETEYQVGRRVEQVVSQPGSIQRLQVVAVVQGGLSTAQQDQIRAVLGAAVGASVDRGDQVIVQPVDLVAVPAAKETVTGVAIAATQVEAPSHRVTAPAPHNGAILVILPVLIAVVLILLVVVLMRRRTHTATRSTRTEPMTDAQRQAALTRLREWMAADEPAATASGVRDGG